MSDLHEAHNGSLGEALDFLNQMPADTVIAINRSHWRRYFAHTPDGEWWRAEVDDPYYSTFFDEFISDEWPYDPQYRRIKATEFAAHVRRYVPEILRLRAQWKWEYSSGTGSCITIAKQPLAWVGYVSLIGDTTSRYVFGVLYRPKAASVETEVAA